MQNFQNFRKVCWLALGLALWWTGVPACGSREGANEAAKEKAPAAAAPPAAPAAAKTATDYIQQGKEFIKTKQPDQAIGSFNEALQLDPKSIPALNNRGIAYCEKGEADKAIADFTRVIEIDPDNGKAYNNRAVAYMLKGEKDKGRQDVAKAESLGIAVNPVLIDRLKPEGAKSAGAPSPPPPLTAPAPPQARGPGETKKK